MSVMMDCEQGSPQWHQARLGSLGASSVADAIAKTKAGWGASRANLMARLIAERLTGVPQETYTNAAMQHGTDTEGEARSAYEFFRDAEVVQIGLALHPTIEFTHASPDGLIGNDGILEIKCPNTSTHIDTLLSGRIPGKYAIQIAWQLACTGRQWGDFVSYDPRLPEGMRMFVRRLYRDDERIVDLEEMVAVFLSETASKQEKLIAVSTLKEFQNAA